MPLEILVTFSFTALVLSISPGPSNLFIMGCTLGSGGRAGIAAALGMAIGSLIYVCVAALGLASLFVTWPSLYFALKIGGVCYLLYLGWCLCNDSSSAGPQKNVFSSPKVIVRKSVVVELTNPKTALFFVALLPQFIVSKADLPVVHQFFMLGALYIFISLSCDFLVVGLAKKLRGWLTSSTKVAHKQHVLSGSILILVALWIVIDEGRQLL